MQIFSQLVPTLITCPEQTKSFLHQAQTLFRHALRLPLITENRDSILPETIALCVISHVGQISLQTVHASYIQFITPHRPQIPIDHLSHLHETIWKSAIAILEPSPVPDKEGPTPTKNLLFTNYYLLFATSLLFSQKTATLLLNRVKQFGGDGNLIGHANIGLQPILSFIREHTLHSRHTFLICSDQRLIKACSEKTSLQLRLPKWVTDSIRDNRLKSADIYIPEKLRKLPSPETSQQTTPRPSLKRKAPQYRAEVALSEATLPCTVKRQRTKELSPAPFTSPVTPDTMSPMRIEYNGATVQKLFQSPSPQKSTHPWKWACELRTTLSGCDFPTNDKICELLGLVQEFYSAKKDHLRSVGYQKAIAKIRSLDHEILTVDDAKALTSSRGIGAGLERKVIEIIQTGRLLQAEAVLQNADNIALKELCNVWGIGPVKAMGLISRGVNSVQMLREAVKTNPGLLDRNQSIGLRLYEHLLQRIPRKSIEELEMYVRRQVKKIDTSLDITIAGSYLRGKATCGDVDILVHGPDRILRSGYEKLKLAMKKDGVITDDLIDGDDKYFGIYRFPGRPHARIDLFYVPQAEYPFAILTYTGSAVFNRSMRAKARTLGYSLSHKGLQRVKRSKHAKTQVEAPIFIRNEREIFTLLDIPYVQPSSRSI